ncbi:hypothetical protein F5Y09DRAFT_347484 [Xylaria sp. FL1042]|nr:hypothetical protein F5Y09DRAFT_347484 [Xylaria sp. FL1042]
MEGSLENCLVEWIAGPHGTGLFARYPIRRGSIILAESALFSIPSMDPGWHNMVIQEYNKLTSDLQNTYLRLRRSSTALKADLKDHDQWHILGIFATNAYGIANDAAAIYPTFSRVNHSCTPNACCRYNANNGKVEVRAMIDLAPAEEVLISYLDEKVLLPAASRSLELNFACNCLTCHTGIIQEDEASDENRAKIMTCLDHVVAQRRLVDQEGSAVEPTVLESGLF